MNAVPAAGDVFFGGPRQRVSAGDVFFGGPRQRVSAGDVFFGGTERCGSRPEAQPSEDACRGM